MSKIEHLPVNWTNGIKLNKEHFFKNYFNTIEIIKESASVQLNSTNYGILGKINGKIEAIELEVDQNSDDLLSVRLNSCNAITRNGFTIFYNKDLYGQTNVPVATIDPIELNDNITQKYFIVVSVNPYEMIPVGEPDPDVVPLHHPYALPKVSLHIVPEGQVNTDFLETNFLVVGEVMWHDKRLTYNNSYIPPVRKVCYNEILTEFQKNTIQSLHKLKDYSVLVFRKNRGNKKRNILTDNTFILCNKVDNFFSENIFSLAHISQEEPPVFIVEKFTVLANYISISLNTMIEKERELLLQYYYEWTDIKPSQLTRSIGEVTSLQYNHMDIAGTIETLQKFIVMLERLLKKLSELEYIGLRKENIVVSDDSNVGNQQKTDKTWTIID